MGAEEYVAPFDLCSPRDQTLCVRRAGHGTAIQEEMRHADTLSTLTGIYLPRAVQPNRREYPARALVQSGKADNLAFR